MTKKNSYDALFWLDVVRALMLLVHCIYRHKLPQRENPYRTQKERNEDKLGDS